MTDSLFVKTDLQIADVRSVLEDAGCDGDKAKNIDLTLLIRGYLHNDPQQFENVLLSDLKDQIG